MIFKSIFEESKAAEKFNESVSEFYWHQLDLYANKTIFLDYETNREWNGAQVKCLANKIGQYLVDKLDIRRGDGCALLYKNNDYAQILSVGIIFSGAHVCASYPNDPADEHAHMLSTVQPKIVFAERRLHERLVGLRDHLGLSYKICIMDEEEEDADDDVGPQQFLEQESKQTNGLPKLIGLHKHILRGYEAPLLPTTNGAHRSSGKFPVPVEPDDPAYVLFTSGSTGKQKAVIRSHRNSLSVCHSLRTAPNLWHMNETSVLAGFQELDHGTGTFCSKLTLSTGLKNILMDGWNMEQLLEAIQRHKVTDFCIGTAYLHNLMQAYCQASPSERPDLSSMKNIISIGSPLRSHALKNQFMDLLPSVSVRQAYGMTECGFVSIQARDEARTDLTSVGYQLPTVYLKIIDHDTGEDVDQFDCPGELCVKGSTVSPGYIRAPATEEARFNSPDGFYRTNDMCSIGRDGRISISGRYSEFLIFTDGWKVLPSEIESKLLEHPLIREAAIIGIPHPELPGCHTPRAYIVAKKTEATGGGGGGCQLTEKQVYDFVAADMSEPKHLKGGVKIMDELPRISVGKVDKKALRQMDGY